MGSLLNVIDCYLACSPENLNLSRDLRGGTWHWKIPRSFGELSVSLL